MKDDLIYDIGYLDGEDTAYYLYRGFRVVAVEASPVLAEAGRARFAREIASGQLVLHNVGIADRRDTLTFWVCDSNPEWNSFVQSNASRENSDFHGIDVDCIPLRELLDEHGVPFYLKTDIEGYDRYCLADLDPSDTPAFVSVEAHSLEYLCQLHHLGYRKFKVVNQNEHHVLADRATTPGWAFPFRKGGSGPFGDDSPGAWQTLETVAYDWLHVSMGHPERSALRPGWYDFHAKKG